MSRPTKHSPGRGAARNRLLRAGVDLIRRHGYCATSIDDFCRAAEVTKGAFFHQFDNKECFGVAVANYWTDITAPLFETAGYRKFSNPVDRILGYIRFRRSLIKGDIDSFTCAVGTMVQEIYETSPQIRLSCAQSMFGHAETLQPDIEAAMEQNGKAYEWTAGSLARHIQAVIQGAFILAKVGNDANLAIESLDHLDRYLRLLFDVEKAKAVPSPKPL